MGDGSREGRAGAGAVHDGRGADARHSNRGGHRSRRVAGDREPRMLQGARQTHPGAAQPQVRGFDHANRVGGSRAARLASELPSVELTSFVIWTEGKETINRATLGSIRWVR